MSFKVTIKNLSGTTIAEATFDAQNGAEEWTAAQIANNSWGLPDRWLAFPLTDPDPGYTDTRTIPASGDEPERTEYFYPAQYTVEQSEIDDSANIQARRRQARRIFGGQIIEGILLANDQAGISVEASIAIYNDEFVRHVRDALRDGALETVSNMLASPPTTVFPSEQIAAVKAQIDAYIAANP